MDEEKANREEPEASTRTCPEDRVEIRITRSPEAVRKFMDKGSTEGCEVKEEGAEEPKTEEW